jgi:hypothetical protein
MLFNTATHEDERNGTARPFKEAVISVFFAVNSVLVLLES